MNVKRGDVVLVDFPFPDGKGTKVRPSLVVQNDADNMRLLNTIVVQITGNVQRIGESTQVFIDLSTHEGKQSGLQFDSVVNCVNLLTLDKKRVLLKLGDLSDALMQQVNAALRVALELP